MIQKYGTMMAGGVLALVALKFLAAVALPALALLFGLAVTVGKIALFAAIGYFIWTLFRGRRSHRAEA